MATLLEKAPPFRREMHMLFAKAIGRSDGAADGAARVSNRICCRPVFCFDPGSWLSNIRLLTRAAPG
jgi:hypothetical protein